MTGTIAITGFMASGKTTVAQALARRLKCQAIDLDKSVAQSEQRSVQEIIETDGVEKFRELETNHLLRILAENSSAVVALGGGTWILARNRELLARHGAVTIWLDAPFEVCWQRIESSEESRPLAPTPDTAKTRFDERIQDYRMADIRIEVTAQDGPDEVATRIAELLMERSRKVTKRI